MAQGGARRLAARLRGLLTALAMAGLAPACSGAAPAPPAPPRLVERSFFGMHVFWHDTNLRLLLPPVGSLRLWDTRTLWSLIEPAPGTWDFSRLDRFMALAESLHADVLMTLGGTPRWAAARPDMPGPYGPGSSSPPRALADWDGYVRKVVERYRGRIGAYEVLNEPKFVENGDCMRPQTFYCASNREVAALVAHTAALVKSIDPRAKVLTPGLDGGPGPLAGYVAAGGIRNADALAFHFYTPPSGPALHRALDMVRHAAVAGSRPTLPIWNTEAGYVLLLPGQADPTGAHVELADAPGAVSRQLITLAAAGVARSYYYTWDGPTFALSSNAGTSPTAAGDAYLTTMSWLLGARISPCEPRAGVWRCKLTRGATRATLAWTEPGAQGALGGEGTSASRFVMPLTGAFRVAGAGEPVSLSTEPTLIVEGTPRWGTMLSYVTAPR